MHDIKYFFSIKIIRQFRRTKIFSEGTNYRKYYLKTLFFKIQGSSCPMALPESAPDYWDREFKLYICWLNSNSGGGSGRQGSGSRFFV
jgi:hypothetical protein